MVLPKRLDYGFNGYQVPAMPRGSRSARGRRTVRKKVEGKQMCAFELLATVAGLLEKEDFLSPGPKTSENNKPTIIRDIIKQEEPDIAKACKVEPWDQGSCDEGIMPSENGFKRQAQNYPLQECSQASSAVAMEPAPIVVKSDASEMLTYTNTSRVKGGNGELGDFLGTVLGKHRGERHSPVSAESHQGNREEGEISTPLQVERQRIGNWTDQRVADSCNLEDPMELDVKPPALVSSDSSVEVPPRGEHVFQARTELAIDKDDDENSSGCTQPSIHTTEVFRPQCIGDRRIKRLLASKYWKVGPTVSKDGELSNNDGETKPNLRSRKLRYTRKRTQRSSFKRRKLSERSCISTFDVGISSEGVSHPVERGFMGESGGSAAIANGENGASSSVKGRKSSFQSEDYHVKLSIKSFNVPELFIEMPETATVGSLKRTVMEAITKILGDGLRVGVVLQGKKVRDDNKTLHQAGISHSDEFDDLGFTLEPNSSQGPPHLANSERPHSLVLCGDTEPPNRFPSVPSLDPGISDASPDPPLIATQNCPGSDQLVLSSTGTSALDKMTTNSKALVPIPAMSVEALAVVPFHRKSRRSELAQRRIRRPFSVAEVEALVQAVEKLGTGRWRDVKLRAFDSAKHRTYVDLKDKWKTLVHTARISPQQRRGEPVPQELLDRVLSAHAYWSQQQAKLQVKQQQQAEACVLL